MKVTLITSEISIFLLFAGKTFVGRNIHEVMTIRKPYNYLTPTLFRVLDGSIWAQRHRFIINSIYCSKCWNRKWKKNSKSWSFQEDNLLSRCSSIIIMICHRKNYCQGDPTKEVLRHQCRDLFVCWEAYIWGHLLMIILLPGLQD